MQASFYDLFQSFCSCNWKATLTRKVDFVKCDPHEDWVYTDELDSMLIGLLKKVGIRSATAVIKSWSNTWASSSRLHEDRRLSCVFGCGAEDTLDHYLCCDPLWTAVISNSFLRLELLWSRPMKRLGLIDPSIESLQMLAIAFSCYHSIKFTHLDEVLQMLESGNPYQVHTRLMHYACAHFKDIVGS